jgi:hypothetical protein
MNIAFISIIINSRWTAGWASRKDKAKRMARIAQSRLVPRFSSLWKRNPLRSWSTGWSTHTPSSVKNSRHLSLQTNVFSSLRALTPFLMQDHFRRIEHFPLRMLPSFQSSSSPFVLWKLKAIQTNNKDLLSNFQARIRLSGNLSAQLKCAHSNGEKNSIKPHKLSSISSKVNLISLRTIWRIRKSRKHWNTVNLVKSRLWQDQLLIILIPLKVESAPTACKTLLLKSRLIHLLL